MDSLADLMSALGLGSAAELRANRRNPNHWSNYLNGAPNEVSLDGAPDSKVDVALQYLASQPVGDLKHITISGGGRYVRGLLGSRGLEQLLSNANERTGAIATGPGSRLWMERAEARRRKLEKELGKRQLEG